MVTALWIGILLAPAQDQVPVTDTGWTLTYVGRSYDSATNTTTFTYSMTVADGEKDLSHLVIGTSGIIPVSSTGIVTSPCRSTQRPTRSGFRPKRSS